MRKYAWHYVIYRTLLNGKKEPFGQLGTSIMDPIKQAVEVARSTAYIYGMAAEVHEVLRGSTPLLATLHPGPSPDRCRLEWTAFAIATGASNRYDRLAERGGN